MKLTTPRVVFILLSMGIVLWSCVDLPSSGFEPPDYRSLVRFIHAGRAVDTIAIFVSVDTVKTRSTSSSQVVVGSDTINVRDTLDIVRITKIYHRILADFAASFEILVDGGSKGSLSLGQATPYLDTPSGSRKIALQATVPLTDSTTVSKLDSTRIVVYDTVGRGQNRVETSAPGTVITSIPKSGSITTIIDSTVVSVATQAKMTLFFIGDTVASVSQEGGVIRFGRIMYIIGGERYTFDNTTVPDTALVRFANASTTLGRDTVIVGQLFGFAFPSVTRYTKLAAPIDTTYTAAFSKSGSSTVSYSFPVSKMKRYTVAVLDSASTFIFRKYDD